MTTQPASPSRRQLAALAAVAAVAAGSVLVAACGSGGSSTPSGRSAAGITVGLITKTNANPYFVAMKEGAERAAKAEGVTLMAEAGDYDGDNSGQVTAVENMVTAGVKGIMITPNDPKAITPILARARQQGVVVIALDTPPDPSSSVDALFATNNFHAGILTGQYAKAAMAGKSAKIAMLDLAPGVTVGIQRHDGFLQGFGIKDGDPSIVCEQDTGGDLAKGQTAMENCLEKSAGINVVYAINQPAALGAYTALREAGKDRSTIIVTIDGSCTGVKAVQAGQISADAQQYPLKMASEGLQAIVRSAKTGKKPSGDTDTGVNLITAKALSGVTSKDVSFGLAHCWG
jgi:fructose transport system substrate-binding protein